MNIFQIMLKSLLTIAVLFDVVDNGFLVRTKPVYKYVDALFDYHPDALFDNHLGALFQHN